jgi:hypothetical protein
VSDRARLTFKPSKVVEAQAHSDDQRIASVFPLVKPPASTRQTKTRKGAIMLIDIQLIEGVFDKSQKQAMIAKITNAMVEIEGEAMRGER